MIQNEFTEAINRMAFIVFASFIALSCDSGGNDEDDLNPDNELLKKEIKAFFVSNSGTGLETYNFILNDASKKVESYMALNSGTITIEFEGDIEIDNRLTESSSAYNVKNSNEDKFIIKKDGKVIAERIMVPYEKVVDRESNDNNGYFFQKDGGSLSEWVEKLKNFHTLKFIEQ